LERRLDWPELGALCESLAVRITAEVDAVVGVSRGGLVPAAYLAYQLGSTRLSVATVKHPRSRERDFRIRGDVAEVVALGPPLDDVRSVLIVDDVASRGGVLSAVAAAVRETPPPARDIHFASLFADVSKIRLGPHADLLPLLTYAEDIDNDRTWILFPWEDVQRRNPPEAGTPA
jgi:hypoxanthine phosphoribosyltransferase